MWRVARLTVCTVVGQTPRSLLCHTHATSVGFNVCRSTLCSSPVLSCGRRAYYSACRPLHVALHISCVVRNRKDISDDGVTSLANTTKRPSEGDDGGFHEDAVVSFDDKGNAVTRIRRVPLTLIEEVPLPVPVYTDIELVMMAWCEEHARRYAMLLFILRCSVALLMFIILYVFYRTQIASERVLRGVANMPRDLRIGSVVYFDISENGMYIGRIAIGLLTESCPLYCEYFHRRCTGNGAADGESFRGMHLRAILPRHCLIFGDGQEMTHEVPGFNPHYLPTEYPSRGAWRGALSSIAYGANKESPNFILHISSGDYKPQVFGMVVGGYDVIERMSWVGSKHGSAPKRDYVIEQCGELCTLAKSLVVPMPWKLYESVSRGYDAEKFGPASSPELLSLPTNAAATSSTTDVPQSRIRRLLLR